MRHARLALGGWLSTRFLSRRSRRRILYFLSRLLVLFLFLGNCVPHCASGHCARYRVMARHMAGDSADNGSLDATFCVGGVTA